MEPEQKGGRMDEKGEANKGREEEKAACGMDTDEEELVSVRDAPARSDLSGGL